MEEALSLKTARPCSVLDVDDVQSRECLKLWKLLLIYDLFPSPWLAQASKVRDRHLGSGQRHHLDQSTKCMLTLC